MPHEVPVLNELRIYRRYTTSKCWQWFWWKRVGIDVAHDPRYRVFIFNSFKARWKYHAYLLSSFFKDVLRKITMHCVLQAQSGDYVNVTHQIRLRFVKEIFSCSNSVQNATCDFSLGTKLMLGRSFPLQRWGFCRIYSVFFALPSYRSAVFTQERIRYTVLVRRINHVDNVRLIGNSEHFNFFTVANYKFISCFCRSKVFAGEFR